MEQSSKAEESKAEERIICLIVPVCLFCFSAIYANWLEIPEYSLIWQTSQIHKICSIH